MKKVFLLTNDPLMLKAWEVRLRNSSWELYALDDTQDYSFRLEEFAPDLVMMTEEIASAEILAVTQIPNGVIPKPLDINRLEDILDELFAQLS